MVETIDKRQCTGCKMCADICPTGAISFDVDEEGFWYPKVDWERCVKCGICERKCPSLADGKVSFTECENAGKQGSDKKNGIPDVYAVWSLDEKVRFRSTSGGVYYELAKSFLEAGGYIAGCIYTEDFMGAIHIAGNTMQDLERIMGSKYFQSDTDGIYKTVAALLKEGQTVLFCGTPCQIAALLSFLDERPEKLFLLDFICKGVNSPFAFRAYMQELENRYGSKVKSVTLKSKISGWASLGTYVRFENGREYHKDRYTDWWIRGYTGGNLFMRETCQQCLYKEIPHQADITFGDFWGIEGCGQEDMEKGISVVFVNTESGKKLMEQIKAHVHCEKREAEEVFAANPYLLGQAVQHPNRNEFFSLLKKMPFSRAVRATYVESFDSKIKRYVKIVLKKYFRRKKW